MLVLAFLVGLLSLILLVFNAQAAPVAPTGTPTTTVLTAQTIMIGGITSGASDSGLNWSFATSLNNVTRTIVNVTTPTTTKQFTFTGLATNTLYYLAVASGDGAATSSYATSSAVYTLADTPGSPTLSTAAVQGFKVTINSSSNPSNTTYIVRDTVSSTLTKYLQSDQTWGNATATFTYAQLGGLSGTTTAGLATNTLHRISVAAVNGDAVTTTYSSTVDFYTLAATPGTATVTSSAVTTLNVTVNAGTNPTTASTTFIVKDTGSTLLYLQSNGTWGSATATLTYAQLGSGSATTTTGLTANTLHTISVAAVNGDSSATTSYSTVASSYTLANTPSSVSLSAAANGFNLTWSGDATQYYVEDETAGSNSGWITATTYSVGGINCGTSRTFRVKGRNGDTTDTAFATSVSATTNACGGGVAVAVPATPATPATPAVPGVSPAVPATPASVSLPPTASPVAVFVHTLRAGTRGGEVKQLQQKLRELGFFKYSSNTGLFGAITKAAVVSFQKDQGLTPSGVVDAATRDALNGVSATAPQAAVGQFVSSLAVGSRGEEVRMLQAKLRELGYFTYPTDTGVFGPATRAAVQAFQRAQGLAPFPGFVGPGTRAALNNL